MPCWRTTRNPSVISLVVNAGVGGFLCAVRGEPFSTPWGDEPGPESDDPSDDAWAAFAEANAAITTGRLDVALERAVHATDTMFELSSVSDDYLHMWPVAVDLALRVDEDATVSRLLSVTDEVAERVWTPLAIAAHRARFAGLVGSQHRARGGRAVVAERRRDVPHLGLPPLPGPGGGRARPAARVAGQARRCGAPPGQRPDDARRARRHGLARRARVSGARGCCPARIRPADPKRPARPVARTSVPRAGAGPRGQGGHDVAQVDDAVLALVVALGAMTVPAHAAGSDVAKWQRRLNALHCDAGPVDGRIGTWTRSAIIRFQSRHGLAQTGSVQPGDQETAVRLHGPAVRRTPGARSFRHRDGASS